MGLMRLSLLIMVIAGQAFSPPVARNRLIRLGKLN